MPTAARPVTAIHHKYYKLSCLFFLFTLLFCTICNIARGQHSEKLSLSQALSLAQINNKMIQKFRIDQEIAEEEIKEKWELRLPEIDFNSSYARITDLTEFRHGLGDKVVTYTIPVIANVTAAAKMPLYTGGRIKYGIRKAEQERDIAGLQLQKTINDVKIVVTGTFLRIYKMMELQKLILANIREEEDRLKEVKSFKAHGTVTRNEVLREELQLSDMQLAAMTNQRNTAIGIHELQTILQLPEHDQLEIDTTGILSSPITVLNEKTYMHAAMEKEEMRIAHQQENIRLTERRITKGNYFPTVNFFTSYGFNYPNYMFFPPDPYLYTLGRVGIEATFSISNLYKNRTKMNMAEKQIQAQNIRTDIVKNAVSDDVFKQFMQFQDIQDKIPVTEKAMKQAAENYRIVRLKYLNQLSLITEMIDADNELLKARFNVISTKIDAVMKYYELQHASGLLQ